MLLVTSSQGSIKDLFVSLVPFPRVSCGGASDNWPLHKSNESSCHRAPGQSEPNGISNLFLKLTFNK